MSYYIYHLRRSVKKGYSGSDNRGGVTIIATLLPNNRTVFAKVSVCSMTDNFSRSEGRHWAEKNFKAGQGIKVPHTSGRTLIEDIIKAKSITGVGLSERQLETIIAAIKLHR